MMRGGLVISHPKLNMFGLVEWKFWWGEKNGKAFFFFFVSKIEKKKYLV